MQLPISPLAHRPVMLCLQFHSCNLDSTGSFSSFSPGWHHCKRKVIRDNVSSLKVSTPVVLREWSAFHNCQEQFLTVLVTGRWPVLISLRHCIRNYSLRVIKGYLMNSSNWFITNCLTLLTASQNNLGLQGNSGGLVWPPAQAQGQLQSAWASWSVIAGGVV